MYFSDWPAATQPRGQPYERQESSQAIADLYFSVEQIYIYIYIYI